MISKYPDGSSYATVTPMKHITFRVNSYEDLWHLNQIVDAQNSVGVEPTVLIPNLIDAQADRRFAYNQSSGLKLVCKFLNSMKADFFIFHPHNSDIVSALIEKVTIVDNEDFISKVFKNLSEVGKSSVEWGGNLQDNLILLSPDAGAYKPLIKLCDNIGWEGEVYSASKSRDGKTGKLTQILDRQDFQGKDILIIDDICVYGGTFKCLAKLLREKNCGKLYLAVSHMTVQNLGNDPVTKYFNHVFTTNSKYENYWIGEENDIREQPNNLTVIKLF